MKQIGWYVEWQKSAVKLKYLCTANCHLDIQNEMPLQSREIEKSWLIESTSGSGSTLCASQVEGRVTGQTWFLLCMTILHTLDQSHYVDSGECHAASEKWDGEQP